MKKIKIFSCYTGYGGAEWALKKANIPFEVVGYSEIKKSAIECYENNLGNHKNYGDITKINPEDLPEFDLITGGFPCQDVSIAGLRDLKKGRTNTVFKMLDIIKEKKPKYCLLENVQGFMTILNGELLREVVRILKSYGYAVSYELLYSKNHGIPQNRPRLWIAAELNRTSFMFNPFPKKEELKIFVKDILQYNINHTYLNDKQVKAIIKKSEERGKPLDNRINPIISTTLTSKPAAADSIYIKNNDRIRNLTPKEYFRLMGFLNDEINLSMLGKTSAYDLAGNGWDINLVSKIFKIWLKDYNKL